jgi:hypothetical protein
MRKTVVCLAAVCLASAAWAQTVAVGTCKPTLPKYNTIQLAVNSVPAGATIQVCPGSYAEQVTINKNLTLKGIQVGTQNSAAIVVPLGGVVQNTVSLGSSTPTAAQVLIQSPATAVNISNIVVDGSNNGISGCGPDLVGVYYQNASGSITRSGIINQALTASLNGCQSGLGIYVESGSGGASTVSITNNNVEGFQKNGITGNEAGTKVTITGNTVIGQGPTTGAAENSIQIGFGATGSVSTNIVGSDVWAPDTVTDPGDAAAGILVYASPNILITHNTVSNTQFGIAIVSDPVLGAADGASVLSNTVTTTHIFDGIDLCSSTNTVTTNNVNGSDESAIHVDDSCTGAATNNSVTKNTINTACAGILNGPGASGGVQTPNTYFNTVNTILNGSNTCTPALAAKAPRARQAATYKRVKPARL